jgi:hypothetical protein
MKYPYMIEEAVIHPEQMPDEIYMGVTNYTCKLATTWKTKRYGTIDTSRFLAMSLMSSGRIPWFIKIREAQALLDALPENCDEGFTEYLKWIIARRSSVSHSNNQA